MVPLVRARNNDNNRSFQAKVFEIPMERPVAEGTILVAEGTLQ
jgi:hypothetical protein